MWAFVGEPDVIYYDKIFDSKEEAIEYEHKVLQEHNCKNSFYWLNRHDGDLYANLKGIQKSEKHKEKISNSKKGINLSETHKENISKGKIGKAKSKEHIKNISKSANKIKIEIDGITYKSITEASKKFNVTRTSIYRWIKKGKAKRIDSILLLP